jgi:hypothetical protein
MLNKEEEDEDDDDDVILKHYENRKHIESFNRELLARCVMPT